MCAPTALTLAPPKSKLTLMDGFWVRQNGRQFWAGDIDALIRMVAEGRLGRDDEVYTGSRWERAGEFEALRSRFGADPFEAWSDADHADADAVYQSYLAQTEPPRGLRSVPRPGADAPPPGPPPPGAPPPGPPPPGCPQAGPPPPARGPRGGAPPRAVAGPRPAVPAPAPDDETEEDTDEPTDPGMRVPTPAPRGEVIDFPRSSAAPPRLLDLPPPPRREPRGPVPLVRPFRLLLFISVGAVGVLTWYTWIRWAGTTDAGVSKPPPVRAVAVVQDDALEKVDRELRGLLSADARPLTGPDALSDALLIDLQHMHVDVATVHADVTEWTGRGNDQPKRADLRIVLGSPGDLDRTLGAIALVVGRYGRTYRLQLDHVDVVIRTAEGERARSMDAMRAQDYYMDRISLEKMLEP